MKSIPHPSGVPILFDSKWHRYKMGSVALKSVSKVLDYYFPFDEKRVLAIVSKKTGESESVIKEKWNRQALLGKNVHEYIESKLLQRPKPTFCLLLDKLREQPDLPGARNLVHGEETLYLPVADQAVEKVQTRYEVIAVEQVVACPSLGIAGTIDVVARNRRNGNILIGDWKTSGSVASDFRFGKFESGSLGCLRHLPNSKVYRYALQIAIYGEILRREKYFEAGYFDTAAGVKAGGKKKKSAGNATKKAAADQPHVAPSLEYGLIQLSKDSSGGVAAEFVGISESTILPKDQPEVTFQQMLQLVLQGM